MNIGIWIVAISFAISSLLFLLAVIAYIASNIVNQIDRKRAVTNTASVMRRSSLSSRIQATAMVFADTSTSARAERLFHWFENLSLASLVILGLGLIAFLISAFFIGI